MVKNWILAPLFAGDPFILVAPNFVKFYLFVIFAYSENFMCLACMVKQFEI